MALANNFIIALFRDKSLSLINSIKSKGPRTDRWRTLNFPLEMSSEQAPFVTLYCFLSER